MKHLYKVGEYSEKLPNPKSFPTQGAIIVGIKDCPNTFSDGFMMDLLVPDSDRERLKGRAVRWMDKGYLNTVLEGATKATILLSEPEYIYATNYVSYILSAPNIKPVGIQVKYYKYFRNRYPDCKFCADGEPFTIVLVKVEDKIVGLCMPIMLPQNKIQEEIQ